MERNYKVNEEKTESAIRELIRYGKEQEEKEWDEILFCLRVLSLESLEQIARGFEDEKVRLFLIHAVCCRDPERGKRLAEELSGE